MSCSSERKKKECRCGSDCDCGHHGRFHRRFRTREEKIAGLESYLKDLEAETCAVREHLAQMKKKK